MRRINMQIAGIQKNSLIDFPGKISIVVFTPNCNMNCFYCHNQILISNNNAELIETDAFLKIIKKRKFFLDGVVITGGEPTLQKDLEDFIKKVKDLGYLVKLDTNGTNPKVIESLINENLVDYIAMDVKAPFSKYNEVCGVDINITNIKRSIEILKKGIVDYEFRTTVTPNLDMGDFYKIAYNLAGARLYVLQKCREVKGLDFKITYDDKYLIDIASKIKYYVQKITIRGI